VKSYLPEFALILALLVASPAAAQNELFVANFSDNSVTVYDPSANGNTPPLRTLSGAATGLHGPAGVAVDLTNNELFVVNRVTPFSVTVYSRTASGDTAPLRTLSGPATGLASPLKLALDLTNNELFVVNVGGSVTVYSRTASGNTAPLRTISGADTGLCNPEGVALDLTNNELFVANTFCGSSITVYSRSASGNTAPLRTLDGGATGLNGSIGLAVSAPPAPPTALVAAVLPSSRSVQLGTTATAFTTIINAGPNTAFAVGISLASASSANFTYAQTNCATNAVIAADNVPANIGPGGQACYVISITPTAALAPTEVAFNFAGTNTAPVATLIAINTLLLSASSTPVPDMVALAATATGDGILHLPGPAGAGAFAVATSNVGTGGLIIASANTGSVALGLALSICQTDPVMGLCISPIGPSVSVQITAGATATFAIFATAGGTIVLDPATNRIFVVFADGGSVVRGRTSVAVSTQ
jgi:hypothetical protein